MPALRHAEQRSWARIVDMAYGALPTLDLARMAPVSSPISGDPPNLQTDELFAAEAAAIEAAAAPIPWIRPSDHDPDRFPTTEAVSLEPGDAPELASPVGAGRIRGLLLDKLMEEVPTGELVEDVKCFVDRAQELLVQLVLDPADEGALPNTGEIAATAWRTLRLPEIAALRAQLVPEWPVYASLADRPLPSALAGRIDAIAYNGDRPEVVIDWKSDFEPDEADMRDHAGQLGDYPRATGAQRGALVYMTAGMVRWVVVADSLPSP